MQMRMRWPVLGGVVLVKVGELIKKNSMQMIVRVRVRVPEGSWRKESTGVGGIKVVITERW